MSESAQNEPNRAAIRIHLVSLNSPVGETWILKLESDILTLSRPEDHMVLQVHRDEAARNIRFAYDVLRGRVVTFFLVLGGKNFSFQCSREQQLAILRWLPAKASSYLTRQVRLSAVGVALFGVVHLLIPQSLQWACGACLLALGCIGFVFPKRTMFMANGVVLTLAGLWDLSTGSPVDLRPWNVSPEQRVFPVVVGSLVLLWGIQQISMMSPNQWLRVVRAVRDEHEAVYVDDSPTVRLLGFLNIAASAIFGLYALALVIMISLQARTPAYTLNTDATVRDLVIFGVFSLLTNLSAIRFLASKKPAYTEAKVSGQFLLSVLTFSVWGAISNLSLIHPLSTLSGMITANPVVFIKPYVWGSLIVLVLAFNSWFNRVVDRELEEQRG